MDGIRDLRRVGIAALSYPGSRLAREDKAGMTYPMSRTYLCSRCSCLQTVLCDHPADCTMSCTLQMSLSICVGGDSVMACLLSRGVGLRIWYARTVRCPSSVRYRPETSGVLVRTAQTSPHAVPALCFPVTVLLFGLREIYVWPRLVFQNTSCPAYSLRMSGTRRAECWLE